jgi:thymidylate synthase (FAD)
MNHTLLYNSLGFSTFIDQHGDDWRVVEAARHSYGSAARKGIEADTKLINYLMTNRHTSPFEQCSITWNLRMPIFVMRQFVRHRTFKLNEESARYTEMRDDFYIPTEWRSQDPKNKQGSYPNQNEESWHKGLTEQVKAQCEIAYGSYLELLRAGVAREQARLILPVNLMTTIIVNIDLHNLMHFLRLRLDSHAQLEIRVLSSAMYWQFWDAYPVIAEAFTKTLDSVNQAPIERNTLNF